MEFGGIYVSNHRPITVAELWRWLMSVRVESSSFGDFVIHEITLEDVEESVLQYRPRTEGEQPLPPTAKIEPRHHLCLFQKASDPEMDSWGSRFPCDYFGFLEECQRNGQSREYPRNWHEKSVNETTDDACLLGRPSTLCFAGLSPNTSTRRYAPYIASTDLQVRVDSSMRYHRASPNDTTTMTSDNIITLSPKVAELFKDNCWSIDITGNYDVVSFGHEVEHLNLESYNSSAALCNMVRSLHLKMKEWLRLQFHRFLSVNILGISLYEEAGMDPDAECLFRLYHKEEEKGRDEVWKREGPRKLLRVLQAGKDVGGRGLLQAEEMESDEDREPE